MIINRDNLHFNFREIDGYNKDIEAVISAREPGKTTSAWLDKVYTPWKKDGRPWIYMSRNAVDFSEEHLHTIQDQYINKFLSDDEKITLQFTASKAGVASILDVKINNKIFFRCVSLNAKMRTIKSNILANARGALMDEFICNPKLGERYLPDEWARIQEAYSTWKRACNNEKSNFKLLFLGNPYSLFNPVFVGLKVDITKLKRGAFYVGEDFVIQWALLNPKLREILLAKNPLAKLDEDYGNYALDGYATNDNHIRQGKRPDRFTLHLVVRYNDKFIGFYKNNYVEDLADLYHCEFVKDFSKERRVFVFDFNDMIRGTQLFTRDDKDKFYRFRLAVGRNLVTYSSAEVYYIVTEIYKYL